jgi:hypothetical protein
VGRHSCYVWREAQSSNICVLGQGKKLADITYTLFQPTYNSSGFNCTEEENASSLRTLRRKAWQALRAKVDEQTSDANILNKLRSTFEERFRYDENGVPRVWKPDDDIDTAYRKARDPVGISGCALLLLLIMPIFIDSRSCAHLFQNLHGR